MKKGSQSPAPDGAAAVADAKPASGGQSAPFTMADLWPQTKPLASLEDLIEEHAEALAENGGDLEAIPEIAALLAFDEAAFFQQLERWALKVLALKADAEAVKLERVRLEVREKRWTKAADSLKGYMQRQMQGRRIGKHKTPAVTVALAKNSQPTVRATSESALEELYASGSPFVEQVVSYKLKRDDVLLAHAEDEKTILMVKEKFGEQLSRETIEEELREEARTSGMHHDAPTLAQMVVERIAERVADALEAGGHTLQVPDQIVVERGMHVRIS